MNLTWATDEAKIWYYPTYPSLAGVCSTKGLLFSLQHIDDFSFIKKVILTNPHINLFKKGLWNTNILINIL